MTLDIRQNKTGAASVDPVEVWTTPQASVVDGSGSVIASPAVTQDAVATTIASASNAYTLTLTSTTGVSVGSPYLVTHDGSTAVCTVDNVSGSVVSLTEALPWQPVADDTFEGLRLSCTIPSAATAKRGTHYAVIWTDAADDTREQRTVFHVVRRAFLPPITAQDVRRLVTTRWPADVLLTTQYDELVDTVTAELRDELLAAGVYAHAYIDPGPFRPVARVIARRLLAIEHGLFPANRDPAEYLDALDRERQQMLSRVFGSIVARDADDDGETDADEPAMLTVRRTR